MKQNNSLPKVSICTMTKDLGHLIADGMNSWLAQKTDFAFEIVLSDDNSSDNTLEIVHTFREKHPEQIVVLTSSERLGLAKNWIKCMQACRGKYIAFCDGDDVWTDPLKLQKQVEYLEANPTCNLVCADYDYIDEHGNFIESEWKRHWYGKSFDIVENLSQAIATTLTTVIRKSALDPLLKSISLKKHPFIWDTVLWAYTLKTGYGYFYPEKLALRRVQSTGEYTTKTPVEKAFYDINSLLSIKKLIEDKQVQRHANENLYALNMLVAKENFKSGNFNMGRRHLLKSVFDWKGTSYCVKNAKYLYWYLRSYTNRAKFANVPE